jgi:hypothetical protein
MKTPCFVLVAAAVLCGLAAAPTPAAAQTARLHNFYNFEVPYYLIQVEYAVPSWHGGYGGRYHYYPYTYKWVTVAESDDLSEATFIYDLYDLARQLGVLDEVAPEIWNWTPVRVRMITEYRPFLVNSR